MSNKKLIIAAISSIAGLSLSSIAFASGNVYGPAPIAAGPCDTGAGFVVGIAGGYADTHWDNILNGVNTPNAVASGLGFPGIFSGSTDDDGFAARGFVGYDFNHYFGLEAGYTYLPKATATLSTAEGSASTDIKNYAVDILAKLMVPVVDGFGIYAKAGGAYFHSKEESSAVVVNGNTITPPFDQSVGHFGPAYGVGATYELIPNLALDLSWMRYSGDGEIINSNGTLNTDYQPNPDVVLLGLSYKFPTNYS